MLQTIGRARAGSAGNEIDQCTTYFKCLKFHVLMMKKKYVKLKMIFLKYQYS